MRVFLLFLSLALLSRLSEAQQKVCLNMIVKDESLVIRRCLESVKPLIDYWVIVDTGSKDGTQEIIKEFMADIPGELHERPWVNFSHNRNEALSLAKGKSDYVFFIDADDKVVISPDFIRPTLNKDVYSIKIQHGDYVHFRPQLVNNNLDWKWIGVVHEGLACTQPTSSSVLDGVTMLIVGGGNRSQDNEKYAKDAQLLEEAVKKEPGNTRNVFYLAQSYRDAGMYKEAIANYEKRSQMGGYVEEVFYSLYQIGTLQELLQMPEEVIRESYCKAFSYRPSRVEPLYRLCKYYRRKESYYSGYLISLVALTIKPTSDSLFRESWVYDYDLLFEHSICAYWVGNYKESSEASTKLLTNQQLPSNVRDAVERNLACAISKLSPKNELKKVAEAGPPSQVYEIPRAW